MLELLKNKLNVIFYASDGGNEPVKKWIQNLPKEDKKILGEDIKTVQFGWPLGMPVVRNLGWGLWEIRSNLIHKRIARIIFFITQDTIILLHGFIKKNQKTPNNDIRLALQRKKEYERGNHL